MAKKSKGNMFDMAAKKKTTAKKNKHIEVRVPKMESTLKRMAEINTKKAELEAEYAELDQEVRSEGKEKMIELYNNDKKFPGTLDLVAKTMAYQFITSDKYKKVDEERAEELQEAWGDDIVTENTVYSFNTAILMKHMDHISELLMGSKKLSDEDKENLLEAATTYAVAKGTISNLFSIEGVEEVEDIIEDIQPIFSVKAIKEV